MSEFFPSLKMFLHSKSFLYVVIFGCYALLSLFLIDKGLDLTDTGYHLANQMNVATLGVHYIGVLPIYWLSDVVAAGISSLFDGWTLLEMRGVVLALGAAQLLILLRIVKSLGIELTYVNGALITLLGLVMTIPFGCVLLSVDYYTLPTFVSYLFLITMMSFFHRPHLIKIVALVLLTMFLLNLRLTTGFILMTAPLWVTGLVRLAGKEPIQFKRYLFVFYGLCALLIGVELAWIFSDQDIKRHVLSGDWRNEKVHNTADILRSYFEDFFKELGRSYFIPLALLIAAVDDFLKQRQKGQKIKIKVKHLLSMLPYFLVISFLLMLAIVGTKIIALPRVIVLSFSFYLVLFGILYVHAPQFLKKHAALILTGALIPLALFIGTNTGLAKLGYGLPLLVITVYFMALNLPVYKKRVVFFLMVFYLTSLSFLVWKGADQFYQNVKFPHAVDMTYQMQNGKVKGIYTTPNSGKEVDELLGEIERRTEKGDKIFTALSIPMIYFAADRPNILADIPNFDIFQPEKALQTKLPRLCSSPDTTPKVIVVSKKYVFDKNWDKDVALAETLPSGNGWGEQENAVLINKILQKNCKPKTVWENAYFQIKIPVVKK